MNKDFNQEQKNNFEKCLQEANQEIEKKYWKITNRLNRWLPTERFKRYWLSRCWSKWTTFSKNDLINKNFVGFLVNNGALDYKNQDFLRRYDHFIDYDFEDYIQDHARVNIVLMIIITQEDPLLMLNNMIKWMSSVANTMVERNSEKPVSDTEPPKQDKRKKHFWKKWRFCTCCWVFKTWSEYHKDSRSPTWYSPQCKECVNKRFRKWKQERKENEIKKEWKNCRVCWKFKSFDSFYKWSKYSDWYWNVCKECAKEQYFSNRKNDTVKKKKEGKIKSLFKKLFRIK